MNNWQRYENSQRGFTLIEMAVVLAVIGLILGAVSIGKDVQRNAEYAKVKQKFVDGWVQAYNSYYKRIGVVVGDSQVAPKIIVNGANFTTASVAASAAGNMGDAGVSSPGPICQGTAVPQGLLNPLGLAAQTSAGITGTLHTFFDQAGVRMPPGRAEGQEDRYVYLDSNGNPQELQVCFQWNKPNTTASGSGNVMVITGLTPDLARSLDQMIDGKPDAREGVFRQQGVANGTGGVPGLLWSSDNTDSYTVAGANLDEDQVAVVTAIYQMNQ